MSKAKTIEERRASKLLAKLVEQVKALPDDRRDILQTDVLEKYRGNTAARQRRYEDAQRAKGRSRVNWWLDSDIRAAVSRLVADMPGDRVDAVNRVLRVALDSMPTLVDSGK